jgi:hypothetical protein
LCSTSPRCRSACWSRQTREAIEEEALSLSRVYERGGLPSLVRSVTQRSRRPGANLYLLADPNGRPLAGNVESLDPGVLDTNGWTRQPFAYRRFGEDQRDRQLTARRCESRHRAIAQVSRLPNQMIVLIGRDLGEPGAVSQGDPARRDAGIGLDGPRRIADLVLCRAPGAQSHRHMSEASRRIMGGDLSGRLPVTGSGDEFDRLSENLNTMLARIAR